MFQDESGQGLVEYSLILALIALVVVSALGLVGLQLKTAYYERINDSFPDV